ncbi:MAG: GTP-binding protein, partial [Nitrospira sp.]|nr:GTP-binding protein [Nitrospira sp.]
DLIDEERRAALLGELAELNPRADLRPTVRAEIDIESLLSRNGSTVERDDEPESHDHRHDHYLSMTLKPKGTAGRAAFEALLTEGAPGLLRAKGFLTVEGLEPQAVVQWTAGHWELIPLPDTIPPRDNVLVFIGEHLDRPGLAAKLRECGLEVAEPHDHDHAHDHHHDHDHHDHGHGHGH